MLSVGGIGRVNATQKVSASHSKLKFSAIEPGKFEAERARVASNTGKVEEQLKRLSRAKPKVKDVTTQITDGSVTVTFQLKYRLHGSYQLQYKQGSQGIEYELTKRNPLFIALASRIPKGQHLIQIVDRIHYQAVNERMAVPVITVTNGFNSMKVSKHLLSSMKAPLDQATRVAPQFIEQALRYFSNIHRSAIEACPPDIALRVQSAVPLPSAQQKKDIASYVEQVMSGNFNYLIKLKDRADHIYFLRDYLDGNRFKPENRFKLVVKQTQDYKEYHLQQVAAEGKALEGNAGFEVEVRESKSRPLIVFRLPGSNQHYYVFSWDELKIDGEAQDWKFAHKIKKQIYRIERQAVALEEKLIREGKLASYE